MRFGKRLVDVRSSIDPQFGGSRLQKPKARESLLTPSMRSSTSKSSIKTDSSSTTKTTTEPFSPLVATPSTSTLSIDMVALALKDVAASEETGGIPPMQMVHAVNAVLMERTPFAIDDAKEDEDANDDGVMDEVDAFLEAHDSGLTGTDDGRR